MAVQTCLRCGRECDEMATVCFGCGAPLGETKTPTQPVPVPKLPRIPQAEAPEGESGAHNTYVATASPPKAQRRRHTGRWIIAALVVVLLAGIGGGVYYVLNASFASLSGPPVATTSTYADPYRRFTFKRPTLWLVTPESDGVLLTDSDGTSTARVVVSAPTPGEDAAKLATTLAAPLGLKRQPPLSADGITWQQRSGQVVGKDGAVRQVLILVTLHDGYLYTLECSSPVASFDSTNNLVYQPLLASFAFR